MADERSLGWLHLTDLHVGQPREGGRSRNIEQAFLEDLERVQRQEKLVIGVIFFSGDIAFRGSDAEYVGATALLGRVCERVWELNRQIRDDAPPPWLVPVPGNHDLVRPKPAEATLIRAAFAGRGAGTPDFAGAFESVGDLIGTAFAPYMRWLECTRLLPFPNFRRGLLPGDVCATLQIGGVSLGVVGLNATYLHLGDDGPGGLHVDYAQLLGLLASPNDWCKENHFNVLVTHHPPSWLSPAAKRILEDEIKHGERFDLHLYGHEHVGGHEARPGAVGIRHFVQGRALFGAEEDGHERLHGYTVGRFTLGRPDRKSTRGRSVEIWTREAWSDGRGWRFGPAEEGLGRWSIRMEFGRSEAPEPSGSAAPSVVKGLGRRQRGTWTQARTYDELARAVEAADTTRWIFLSGSVPAAPKERADRMNEKKFLETARPEGVVQFVAALARRARDSGGKFGILYGGHPSITQALTPVALQAKEGARPWLALVQDDQYWDRLVEDVGVLVHLPGVLKILTIGAASDPDLEGMRTALLTPRTLVAAVFVGGLSGVAREYAIAEKQRGDLPRFATGVGGGAAATLLRDQGEKARGAPSALVPEADLWHTPASAADAILKALG